MPAILPPTSKIGTLLRLLEEAQSEKPTEAKAADQPSAPLRETVEAPLEAPIAPESQGTERVVSLKPEGSTLPSAESAPETLAPTTAKVGPIGGPEGGVTGTPSALQAQAAAPQERPSLQQYLDAGKTAAQYYAETGQQSTLDQITGGAAFGGVGDTNQFLATGQSANPDLQVNPQTGQLERVVRQGTPNTATLQDYLNQGKTAAQWYAETGRQGEMDALTQGATQAMPTQAYSNYGALPPGAIGPQAPNVRTPIQGSVLGAQSLIPSTQPEVGPPGPPPGWNQPIVDTESGQVLPPANYLPPQALAPVEQVQAYSTMPTPTPRPGSLRVALDKARNQQEFDEAIKQYIDSNPELKAYMQAGEKYGR